MARQYALMFMRFLLMPCLIFYKIQMVFCGVSPLKIPPHEIRFSQDTASHFVQLALRCIQKEYPNKLSHVMNDSTEVQNPQFLHPSFYGCFDWHSAVHGHWMLVKILKIFPNLTEARKIREAINRNLSSENIRQEVAYLDKPNRMSFERTYGWAWFLKLAEELYGWDDPDGRTWSLAEAVVLRYLNFLPKQTYPIRRGVHPNTAFGIAFALDYAQKVDHNELKKLLIERSLYYFQHDEHCPVEWEPDGDDFFFSLSDGS